MNKHSRLAAVLVAAGIFVAGVALALWRQGRVTCPAGTRSDQARQARIASQLRAGYGKAAEPG